MNRIKRLGTLLLLALLASSAVVAGQQDTATITGEVRDASGALIPKAAITVTNTSTNLSVKGESNDSGLYTLVSLRPGLYSVSVEKDGFKRLVRPAITLQVNQVVRLDFTLEVGELSATVEVTTAAQLIESQTSARGAVIEQKKILELPLNGRDYNQLALLSPGVLPSTPRLAAVNFKGAINVNGNRTFNNVFLLDGVDNV
jgi:carboxypeptidase family protein